MKKLLLISLLGWMAAGAWAATNSLTESPADRLPDRIAAPGTSANRSFALSLLQKQVETMAKLRSFRYAEEVSTSNQDRLTVAPYANLNGNSRLMKRYLFSTDGHRSSVRFYTWGNVKSATEFIPQEKCPYNSFLWDGKVFFECVATADKPGRVTVETRANELPSDRQRLDQMLTPLWNRGYVGDTRREILQQAFNLSVRTNREQVGQVRCYVIDASTPGRKFALWIAPERECNIVQVALQNARDSVSWSLEGVVCKQIEGIWIPVEGDVRRSQSFRNGDYAQEVRHHRLTELTLNPDHEALHSFIPDDIKNGASVWFNPVMGQRLVGLPSWQDGRVVDRQGHILFDSGLTDTNSGTTTPAVKK
jgi:hypothetical protein